MSGQRRVNLPVFDAARQSLVIPTVVQDTLVRNAIESDLSYHQSKHNIIEFLGIDRDRTFRTHYLAGAPLLWQKDKSCIVEPMGGQGITTKELDATKLRAFSRFCPKEIYDSAFQAMWRWNASGSHDLAELTGLIAPMLKEDAVQLSVALLSTALLGQLFDYDSIGFSGTATPQEQKDFAIQANSFQGLFSKIVNDMSPGYDWMYKTNLLPDTGFNANGFSGIDISSLGQSLYASAHPDLKMLVNKGSMRDGRGGMVKPMLLISDNLMADVYNKATQVADYSLQNTSILHELSVRVEDGRQNYYWRNIPIIPISEICTFDTYLDSNFVFAGLTCSRNIQIGTNFSKFFGTEDREVGMIVQRVADNDIKDGDAGSYYRDSHCLMAIDIANPKLWCSTFKTYQ